MQRYEHPDAIATQPTTRIDSAADSTGLWSRARRHLIRACGFARWDLPTVLFIGTALLSGFLLRAQIVENPLDPKAFFSDLAVFSLLAAISFLLRPAHRIPYYVSVSVFFCIILIGDAIYFRAHESVVSLFLVDQLQFLPAVADSCQQLLRASDIMFVANTVLLLVGLLWLRRTGRLGRSKESRALRARKLVTSLVVALTILGLFGATLSKREASRLFKQWNRIFLVERFGVYGYHASDIAKYVGTDTNVEPVSAESFDAVVEFFADQAATPQPPNPHAELLAGQNVLLVHSESVQTMFMFEEVAGQEITPNLNRIARRSFFFDNFYSQHSSGTSSDSEFTLNTSLFPINDGTVFVSHFGHTFQTLPRKLKERGYTAVSLHGNNASFWNRDTMNKTLGYDRFYAKRDFEIDEVIGMGLSDMSFFRQSLDVLAATPQPFYATAIMLSNHTPFADVDKYGPFDSGEHEGTRFGNYLKSLHYADRAIGYLFDELERRGMLENTALVFYGDHPASLSRKSTATFLGVDELDKYDYRRANTVPLIVYSKRIESPKVVSTPMGMIDVFPTIGALLGVEHEFALGTDMLSADRNRVIFPDGSWIDENVLFLAATSKFKVFNDAFVERFYREVCPTMAPPAVDAGLARDYCEPRPERSFKFDPDAPGRHPLKRYGWQYVADRQDEYGQYLSVSTAILDHDLFAPPRPGHERSLNSAHVQLVLEAARDKRNRTAASQPTTPREAGQPRGILAGWRYANDSNSLHLDPPL